MNARTFLALVVIAFAVGVGYSTTQALFSDTVKNSGTTFTVGTLDLDVESKDGSTNEAFIIGDIGADGNLSGSKTWVVNNAGSLKGKLFFNLSNILNNENGCNEPEAAVDETCSNPGAGEGELGEVITAKVFLDDTEKFSTPLSADGEDLVGKKWKELAEIILDTGDSVEVKMEWYANPEDYGNEIQSDSLEFDISFDLVQVSN